MSHNLPDLIQIPSPNCGARRDGLTPRLIVLHYTAMDSAAAALDRLCDPTAEVSAHYLIAGDGRIWQLVAEDQRAWHAGQGSWRGQVDINSRSIGIELDNDGTHPFAEPQMVALEGLMAGLLERWDIPPEGVIAHADMAPARKSDPGARFDWQRLARQGLSIWPDGAGDVASDVAGRDFDALSCAFGYPQEATEGDRLTAFRDRFRPGVTGDVDQADLENLASLVSTWPAPAG